MKITQKQSLFILYVLSLLIAWFSKSFYAWTYFVLTILFLSSIKFILVAFNFMELKKAHSFWKTFIIVYLVVFVSVISIILS